jgi:hypothetical protein
MQFQYIEPPRAGSADAQGFIDLINAVIDRQGNGVEVKIIMSEFEKAGYLEQLQGMGSTRSITSRSRTMCTIRASSSMARQSW